MSLVDIDQVLTGLPICPGGKTRCAECGATLREGMDVVVCADKTTGRWKVNAVVCETCAPGSERLTEAETGAMGRLAVLSDAATQSGHLVLVDVWTDWSAETGQP